MVEKGQWVVLPYSVDKQASGKVSALVLKYL